MFRGYDEFQKLGDLLDAELHGRRYDSAELERLAGELSHLFPSISGTLTRMIERQRTHLQ
jgi:hypothetical protein